MKTTNELVRLGLAKKSITGIAIGDAFGDSFFGESDFIENAIGNKIIPETKWEFTDDTVMAIPLLKSLEKFQEINQDFIANEFAINYEKDFRRGYGPSMHRKLKEMKETSNWLNISKSSFNGEGSMGNGGAMRVALLGAYFYDDFFILSEQTKKSCEITHYNKEAIAGSISVAIASALCTRMSLGEKIEKKDWLAIVIENTPESDLKYKLKKIEQLPENYHIKTIVATLGNGTKMLTQDTVPFAIWNVYHFMDNFENCLWSTVSGLGDRDTTCAIAGGIAIMNTELNKVNPVWLKSVENWEESIFYK
ncbi:ADP-ribosylglycohydrolase family protein [Flavobacterium oreochromis]|uniref:ADP-ribosylglycohydrolase family protein n=1 Tax=Flavobacterium oreochromis TaxID=2906078 RepID=UPI001CE62A7F|nr:ADP-ribosylglycohydrolase family protein [Flavobacterium oreochromis]QYS87463.1 ADP-ribosylglycohydrolase family protein [Flavobacterium oreochromis]